MSPCQRYSVTHLRIHHLSVVAVEEIALETGECNHDQNSNWWLAYWEPCLVRLTPRIPGWSILEPAGGDDPGIPKQMEPPEGEDLDNPWHRQPQRFPERGEWSPPGRPSRCSDPDTG